MTASPENGVKVCCVTRNGTSVSSGVVTVSATDVECVALVPVPVTVIV